MENGIVLPAAPKRKLFFSDRVNEESVSNIIKKIIEINEADDQLEVLYGMYGFSYNPPPIELYIDSYGGNVYQGLGVVGVIETSKTLVHTYVTGAAMSAGFLMLIAGDRRFAYPHSTVLYHQVSGWLRGEVKFMEETVDETKRLQKKMEKIVLEKTNITKSKLKEIYKKKIDWFISAEEALELGIVDEIISVPTEE
jgi:ATP-dependent Clp protease protease subunit